MRTGSFQSIMVYFLLVPGFPSGGLAATSAKQMKLVLASQSVQSLLMQHSSQEKEEQKIEKNHQKLFILRFRNHLYRKGKISCFELNNYFSRDTYITYGHVSRAPL